MGMLTLVMSLTLAAFPSRPDQSTIICPLVCFPDSSTVAYTSCVSVATLEFSTNAIASSSKAQNLDIRFFLAATPALQMVTINSAFLVWKVEKRSRHSCEENKCYFPKDI